MKLTPSVDGRLRTSISVTLRLTPEEVAKVAEVAGVSTTTALALIRKEAARILAEHFAMREPVRYSNGSGIYWSDD